MTNHEQGVTNMLKTTVAELYRNNGETPIQIGDVVELIPLNEYKSMNVPMTPLIKSIAGQTFEVEGIEEKTTDLYAIQGKLSTGELVEFYDWEVRYVFREQ